MNKLLSITLVLIINLLCVADLKAQILIGQTQETIKSYMAKTYPSYKAQTLKIPELNNSDALSYSTTNKQVRIYVFENSKYCTTYLIGYNASELNRVISNFNQTYVKHGELEWLDYQDEVTYHYKLERHPESFIVAVTLYNKK